VLREFSRSTRTGARFIVHDARIGQATAPLTHHERLQIAAPY
jgi:hypothetical protein